MSVQVSLYALNELSSVVKPIEDETVMFDISSTSIPEVLEGISEKSKNPDENGNYWYSCEMLDAYDAIDEKLEDMRSDKDYFEGSDAEHDLLAVKSYMKDVVDYDNSFFFKLYWKIS